ncbi:hypothetical protein GYMLUDRAFT_358211 [Collybiopsis luxurians FD-317 M1]|nr:hypothetical protein GYMLUDRAFT_358211 [Collybiopsis luxurians FD-317 M1]
MMFSSRSWYFVLSSLLVRCRSESATLESRRLDNLAQPSEGQLASSTQRGNLIGATQLYRRFQEHPDSKTFGILLATVIGILIFVAISVLICTHLRRRRILDIEKRAVSLDSGTESALSGKPKRSSWALRLNSAQRKLWSPIARDKTPISPSHPFLRTGSPAGRDHDRASLPFHDIPPLQRPAAVLDPQLDMRENTQPILLPVEGGVLSVSSSHWAADISAADHRRRIQVSPSAALRSPESLNSIDNTVAQTIITKANKQKFRNGSPVSRSRKGSLLSGPPLTVHRQLPISPTEDDLVDISAYQYSSNPSPPNMI